MKRRVITIAVVLAAVVVAWLALWMNEGPLWRAVMLKRVIDTEDSSRVVLKYVRRWDKPSANVEGPCWVLYKDTGAIMYGNMEDGKLKLGSVATLWDASPGRVMAQSRRLSLSIGDIETRRSPPWWPHPPLIDLREFEE